jgi:S-adenosylmethionine:tRNA ribosyltransferase-isomerase
MLCCTRGDLAGHLEREGRPPLPPYIRRGPAGADAADRERYQTVFASRPGAIAAPTAGLHFTAKLLAELTRRGIELTTLTLHVGAGTFLPVTVERVEEHRMHEERLELPAAAARAIRDARARGRRVVAVGTTVVRALEACAVGDGLVEPRSGPCSLFIYPGYRFRIVDAMITNFHLPQSTLLMLVSAFAGRERLLAAYGQAIGAGYRFYSYGDAMLIADAP